MRTLLLAAGAAALAMSVAVVGSSASNGQRRPTWKGTIRMDMAAIARQAKISRADAEKAALASVNVDGAKVAGTELETENDSLIYEVKITANGKRHEVH